MPANHQFTEFWNWFASAADRIRSAYHGNDQKWLDTNITPRVRQIADQLNWEIGPYHAPDDTFVLSPTTRENLALTRAAIEIAPQLTGWRFLHAKPAKQLSSLTFMVGGATVNADAWRYRLTAYNGGEFVDIEIFANASCGLGGGHENLFAELVVEALVGEERRLDRVGYLELSTVGDNATIDRSSPIRHLNDHLSQVLSP